MIAIKGMEMPRSCSQCNLCVEDKYADMTCVLLCEEWEETDYNENHRDGKCPLVEIVTCKDCKYRGTREWTGLIWCKRQGEYQSKDSFCGYGKRRE